jgi:hypothetical protein
MLVLFVHVLSVVLPVLRRRLDAASRAPLTWEVGVRSGIFTVAAFLPLQVATGIALAASTRSGWSSLPRPSSPERRVVGVDHPLTVPAGA